MSVKINNSIQYESAHPIRCACRWQCVRVQAPTCASAVSVIYFSNSRDKKTPLPVWIWQLSPWRTEKQPKSFDTAQHTRAWGIEKCFLWACVPACVRARTEGTWFLIVRAIMTATEFRSGWFYIGCCRPVLPAGDSLFGRWVNRF